MTRASSRVPSGACSAREHLALAVHPGDQAAAVVRHQRPRPRRSGAAARARSRPAARRCPRRCAPRRRPQCGSRRSSRASDQRVGGVRLVDHDDLGHVRRARRRRAPRAPRRAAPPGRGASRRRRAGPGRRRRPPPAWSGTPRPAGAAGAGRSRRCRSSVYARPSGVCGPAHGRVEGGEQRVLDQHAGAGEPVEQRGLAGVGVAGDGDRRAPRGAGAPGAWSSRPVLIAAISRRSLAIVLRMRRRSVSILVSPGPRVPMPPPPATRPPACRDSDSPQPRSRGSMYCICASATCALPSRLRACWAKMSRISAVRSTTLTLTTSSRWLSWPGVSSPSQMTVSAPVATHDVAQLVRLAGADVGGRVGLVAALDDAVEHHRARRLGERGQLGQASSRRPSTVPSVQTPTSTTRSRRSWRYSTSVTSSSSVDRPATRRSAARSARSRSPVVRLVGSPSLARLPFGQRASRSWSRRAGSDAEAAVMSGARRRTAPEWVRGSCRRVPRSGAVRPTGSVGRVAAGARQQLVHRPRRAWPASCTSSHADPVAPLLDGVSPAAASCVPSATNTAGPIRVSTPSPSRRTRSRPPGTSTVYVTSVGRARRGRAAATMTAAAPVPQDWVSPTPRSCTRIATCRGPTSTTNSTLTPSGYARRGSPRARSSSVARRRPGRRRTRRRAGCARTRRSPASVAARRRRPAASPPGSSAVPMLDRRRRRRRRRAPLGPRRGSRSRTRRAARARRRRGSGRRPAPRCRTSPRSSRRRCGSP